MLSKDSQFQKAASPIDVTLSGIVMLSKDSQPQNVAFPIEITLYPFIVARISKNRALPLYFVITHVPSLFFLMSYSEAKSTEEQNNTTNNKKIFLNLNIYPSKTILS